MEVPQFPYLLQHLPGTQLPTPLSHQPLVEIEMDVAVLVVCWVVVLIGILRGEF